jgi:peroxiredoxin
MIRLKAGHDAPNITVTSTSGEQVDISKIWRTQPIVISFIRQFG